MARALLALGSNLGRPAENLDQAVGKISFFPKTFLLARSSWHGTKPIGGPAGQGDFLNGSVLVETCLTPLELSREIHNLESCMGRERRVRWDARLIDIDMLLYGNEIVSTRTLTVPHPRMTFRQFVLEPASEIAGAMTQPLCGWTLARLTKHLGQQTKPVIALVASDPKRAGELAKHLDDQLSGDAAVKPNTGKSIEIATTWPQDRGNWQTEPGLVIAWDCNSQGQLEDERLARNRISWNGPLAMVSGANVQAVVAEALAAVRAAWPSFGNDIVAP